MRRGFTFIELCLGLVTTSLVMSAAAAFMMGVATTWKASGDAQATAAESTQTNLKLQSFFRSCNALGGSTTISVLVWRADNNGDNTIQSSELAALTYDPALKILQLHFPTVSGAGDSTWTEAEFYHPTATSVFSSLPRVSRLVLARVSAAHFAILRGSGAMAKPIVEFDLSVTRDAKVKRHYGSVALRKPVDPL